jgi:hypothetical protein
LIDILNIRPVGQRQGPRGRPALTYDIAELQTLHAAIAPWLLPDEEPKKVFSSIGKCPTMIHCAQARRQEGLVPLQPIVQDGTTLRNSGQVRRRREARPVPDLLLV